MLQVSIAVNGVPEIVTWVADEAAAAEIRTRVLDGAEAGSAIRLEVMEAVGDELESRGTLVLRLGNATAVRVQVLPDDRTGAVMAISR